MMLPARPWAAAAVCSRFNGRAARRRGDRQRPLIGVVRRVQAALGALNLAEVIAHHRG
jgi:hypothetical protein